MSITVPTNPRKFSKAVTKALPVKLTADEVATKRDRIITLLQEKAVIEAELKAFAAEKKGEIKDVSGTISKELTCIKQGIETQRVECVQQFDLDEQKTWFEFRGEKYDETRISEFELKAYTKGPAPMFPDHKDDDVPSEDEEDNRVDGSKENVEPIRKDEAGEIADVISQETRSRGRGKKDHTA